MTRREAMLALGAGALPARAGDYKPRLAAQAYVWEQSYGREKKNPDDHIPEILTSLKRSGYSELEMRAVFFRAEKAEERAALLKKLGLSVPLMYHGGRVHTAEDASKTVDLLTADALRLKQQFGLKALVFNPDPKPKREEKTLEELDTQAAAVRNLGAALTKGGVQLLLHQHDPEMKSNARELRHLLANTDARQVGICLDTHWVLRGGQKVMEILEECTPRLGAMHLRNSRGGVWMEELADGEIDYRAVAAHLKRTGFAGWLVVELAWDKDTRLTRPLEENLKRSRIYAEKVFGVKARIS